MNIREYLLVSGVPRRVVWVSNDLRLASLSIEDELGDLLIKRNAREAIYRAGDHYITGVSPRSKDRLRGVSVDAVFLEDHDALDEVQEMLRWSSLHKKKIWWFDDRGDLKGPF